MHLTRIQVRHIRGIDKLDWEIPRDRPAGWHVILGDNASGKTTLLRAIALALVGPEAAPALRLDFASWVSNCADYGKVELDLLRHPHADPLQEHPLTAGKPLQAAIRVLRVGAAGKVRNATRGQNPEHHLWGTGGGWYSAGFGPQRRFAGTDYQDEEFRRSYPRATRLLTVFDERWALTEVVSWMKNLLLDQMETPTKELSTLERVRSFVNGSELLPHGVKLESVTSGGVRFRDGNGIEIAMEDLADGYRSILSLNLELLRQLIQAFGVERVFDMEDASVITCPGTVLIDEVDAHLHPSWQQSIGLWFRRRYPNMQFLVTTHSPLICQAVADATIFRLPKPGSGEEARMLEGSERDRLVFGNVLDAYGTGAFGHGVERSEASRQHLAKLAELNQKELVGALSENEMEERERLRAMLPTQGATLSAGNR